MKVSRGKLRIIHLIDSLSIGGAEVLLKNTLQLLSEFSHTVVYLQEHDALKGEISALGAPTICLSHRGWKDLISSVRKLRKIIKEVQPDVVHSHLFYATLIARLALPGSVPLVTSLHSSFSKDVFESSRLALWVERLTLRKRHNLVSVSEFVLRDYLQWVSFNGNKYVLYNFLPAKTFRTPQKKEVNTLCRCVAVGNLKEAKNYHYLLEVWEHLKEKEIELHIYGKGHLKSDLEKLINEKGLNVKLCGQAENISDLLPHYDLFIQASQHEGFGLSVIEAMAAGIPVLISDIPVFREISGENAHFFDLHNPKKTAEQIIKLKADFKYRLRYVDAARSYCYHHYCASVYKSQLLCIYEAACKMSTL